MSTSAATASVAPIVEEETVSLTTEEKTALLAYRLWEESGCPEGTAEENWFEAVRILTVG